MALASRFDVVLTSDARDPFPLTLENNAGNPRVCPCLMLLTPTWGAIKFMNSCV